MSEARRQLEEMLEGCAVPSEIWSGRVASRVLRDELGVWIAGLARWTAMTTLTFREERYPDVAQRLFLRLIRALNEDVYGKRYKRIVKHSYFSYVVATEYQNRGVIHFHFLVDRPINFRLLHGLWNEWAGFALTEMIRDPERAARYIAKYLAKGGNITPWVQKVRREPWVKPAWWIETDGGGSGERSKALMPVASGRGSTAGTVEMPVDTGRAV